jgi:hypothetical protein
LASDVIEGNCVARVVEDGTTQCYHVKRCRGDNCICRDDNLRTTDGVIIEVPATDVDGVRTGVIELDPLRCVGGGRHDLVDEYEKRDSNPHDTPHI